MDCQGYYAILRDYMEMQVDAARRAELEQHVDACAECAAFHKLAHEVSCRELAEVLDDYIDGCLAADRCAVFERHLRICAECESYLVSYRLTISLGRSAFEEPNDPALGVVPEKLVRAILAAREKSS